LSFSPFAFLLSIKGILAYAQTCRISLIIQANDHIPAFTPPFYETRFPRVLVARNDRDCAVISNFVAPFSWYGRQRMNYIYFIRDQIENIKKPQLFFIVVSERD
jgi:hypothetical protein